MKAKTTRAEMEAIAEKLRNADSMSDEEIRAVFRSMPTHLQPRIVVYCEYVNIARYNLEQAIEAERKLKAVPKLRIESRDPIDKKNKREYLHYDGVIGYCCTTVLVFSAIALEGYINDIARVYLSAFYRDSLDKLDLPAKWAIIPTQAFGKGFEPGNDILNRITVLQKQRNRLVHPRTRMLAETKAGESEKDGDRIAVAERAIETCIKAIDAAEKLKGEPFEGILPTTPPAT